MLKYYQKTGTDKSTIRDLKICKYLLEVLTESKDFKVYDKSFHAISFEKYVNTKNLGRFKELEQCKILLNMFNKDKKPTKAYALEEIYVTKCLYLYNLIRAYNLFTWWD